MKILALVALLASLSLQVYAQGTALGDLFKQREEVAKTEEAKAKELIQRNMIAYAEQNAREVEKLKMDAPQRIIPLAMAEAVRLGKNPVTAEAERLESAIAENALTDAYHYVYVKNSDDSVCQFMARTRSRTGLAKDIKDEVFGGAKCL